MSAAGPTIRSWRLGFPPRSRSKAIYAQQFWLHRFQTAYNKKYELLPAPNGLLNALVPFADHARRQVRHAVELAKVAPKNPHQREGLIGSFEAGLFDRLFAAASKTLVLELGTAAERKLLVGKTKKARFEFFCDCLTDPVFSGHLLAQYPCLVRRLDTLIVNWRIATEELIERLETDFAAIRNSPLFGADPGALISVKELGDSHAGGRTVGRLVFESGQTIIYKPRSVAMEHGFHAFVNWLNESGLSPDLMSAPVVEGTGYGWVSNINAATCLDAHAVRRFFHREGQNLALMYVLGATDLHYENVIAAGEYPVIVDLETLFHATPKTTGMTKAGAAAFDTLADSVVRTLLLPTRISSRAHPRGKLRSVDISALGYAAGEESPYLVQGWDKWGTDGMQLSDRHEVMPLADCLPEFDGQRINASSHLDELASGFSNAYDFLEPRRRKLLARGGPLEVFKQGTIRHVFRATAHYAQLVASSYHPSFGHDAERLDAHLKNGLGPLDSSTRSTRVVAAAELADLTAGDIPYFRARVSGKTAHSPTRPNSAIALGVNAWRACQNRIEAMSTSDKERQVWLTRMSFVDLDIPLQARALKQGAIEAKHLLETAARIGDRLCDLAINRDGRASWLFPLIETQKHIVPAVVGFDLYNGLPGIGLFLAYLSRRTRNRHHRAVAIAALDEAWSIYRRVRTADKPVGAFEGAAGLAYVMALLGRLLAKPEWSRQSVRIIGAELARLADQKAVDVISGQAGLLVAGVAVGQITHNADLVEVLRPLALGLMRKRGGALPRDSDSGLAHGKAGIGWALGRWAKATGDQSTQIRAMALLKDDLLAVKSARQNAKPSTGAASGASMLAWCRGGLGSAAAAVQLGYPLERWVKRVVQAACKELGNKSGEAALCLCHGSLGVLECLDLIAERSEIVSLRQLSALRARSLSRVLAGEYCADHAHRLDAPGLLVGMAGTGYALLRTLDPENVPSVLMLEAT